MSVWSSMVVSSDHPSCRCLHVVSLVSCSFAIVVSTCPNHTCLIMFAKVLLSCMLHATFPSFSIHFPSISYDFFMFSFLKRSVCESQEFDVAPMLPNGVPTESQRSPNRVPTESQRSPNGGRGGVFESHGRSVLLSALHRWVFDRFWRREPCGKPAESVKAWPRPRWSWWTKSFTTVCKIAKHSEARHAKNIQDPRSKEHVLNGVLISSTERWNMLESWNCIAA